MGKPREFFMLLRSYDHGTLSGSNWVCHGKKGVYKQGDGPEPGDKIIRVREVLPKRRRKAAQKVTSDD